VGLGLSGVVGAYRGQYRIEDSWSRLKGKPLGLTPLYLREEERIQGLVYLLSLALRSLTLLEWVVREQLRARKVEVKNVYAGQAGRQTARPSSELLSQVSKSITVSVIAVGAEIHVLLSPLTDSQRHLLTPWDLSPDLYESLLSNFPKPPPKMSEP
jgi:transposase